MPSLPRVFDYFDPDAPFGRDQTEYHPRSGGGSTPAYLDSEVNKLRHEVERLLLVTESLWTILKEQHGYSDQLLQRRILEIDAADGKIDGRKSTRSDPRECPSCNRVIPKHAARCMWCEALAPGDPFER
ncbi:MAG: hypothetical protein AAGA58_03920 [Verrucomicrobiota bacterium]